MKTQRRSSSRQTAGKPATRKNSFQRFSLPELLEARMMLSGTPYLVTSNADDGTAGTLRFAIMQVNQGLANEIDFSGPMTIAISKALGALPGITQSVVINGPTDSLGHPLVALDGSAAGAGVNGLEIDAVGATVQGLALDNFSAAGLLLGSGGGDIVTGNYIGVDPSGTIAMGNRTGIVARSPNNLISHNVISGNGMDGVDVFGNGNNIENNKIGTDWSGTLALGNNNTGVYVGGGVDVSFLPIPTSTVDVGGNVIAGNQGNGITIENGSLVTVHGNFIGTDGSGNAGPMDIGGNYVFGNQTSGIGLIGNSFDNTIGGSDGNIIGGSNGNGINVVTLPGTMNTIQGNLIGADVMHLVDTNSGNGIDLVTGRLAVSGNIIGANLGDGIFLEVNADASTVTGNYIGTDALGANLGNDGNGVHVNSGGNTIGGALPGQGNVIAFNGFGSFRGDGVFIEAGTGNAIRGNAIFSNLTLGIALGIDSTAPKGFAIPAPVLNDSMGHVGANNFQNFPVITSITGTAGNMTATGTLQVDPGALGNTTFSIDFFTNVSGDPTGFGQGRTYVGSTTVTADGNGLATFSFLYTGATDQLVWSATATDMAGNTSEFSVDVTAMVSTATQTATITTVASSNNMSDFGQPLTFTATVTGDGVNVPTGSVTFMSGTNVLGTGTVDQAGHASVSNIYLEVGNATITALYGGDTKYFGSNGSTSQAVNRAATTTAISSSANIVNAGTNVTFTAIVTRAPGQYPASALLTGTVLFLDGNNQIGSAMLIGGAASFTTNQLAVGSHQIIAIYSSDNSHYTSSQSAPLTETINASAGTISGHTYFDVTGNGLTSDDRLMGGLTVKLFQDNDNNGTLDAGDGAAIKTLVSDNSGAYTFSGLLPGRYFVQEVTPSGYVRTAPTNSTFYTDVMTSGLVIASNDFDNYQTGCCCNSLANVRYLINGKYSYSDLRGHVHQGDTVQVQFTVLSGHTDLLSLVSYTAPGSSFSANTASQQQIYQQTSGTFGPGYHTMTVVVPRCYFQVDFVCGAVIDHFGPAGSNVFYSAEDRLISADNGGNSPPPAH